MRNPSAVFAAEFLNFVEEREQRVQRWGFYDVAFDPADLDTLLDNEGPASLREQWEALRQSGWLIEDLVAELCLAGLLYRLDDGSQRVRSRFAEGVRLLALLRQRFKDDDWASGPRLVSDLKLHLAPRRYPALHVSAEAAWALMRPFARRPDLQRAVFEALCNRGDGAKYDFAGFQSRAFERIFAQYGAANSSGTVVCAGTGSGKTKAFYVPAFTALAPELARGARPFTKVIAVYPRNVLLADQLREAIAEAGKLSAVADQYGLRRPTFGALMGDLPPANQFDLGKASPFLRNWQELPGIGWVVPFLRAPFHPTRGELVWRHEDRRAGRTCLYRRDALDEAPEVPDGVLHLTREALQATPPDFLFLSLEMLHRELGNPAWAATFGIGVDDTPRLLLFDEVHNYSGLSGAQAPWIIARWRQAARLKHLHVVGLSATLKDAPQHLSVVGCVPADRIVECTPYQRELEPEGREYTVIAKGDPSLNASLLATSIQAAMLMLRLQQPRHQPYPAKDSLGGQSLYLRKVFGFTDQLDSLNRWHPDLNDAERQQLAKLRLPIAQSGRTVSRAQELAMDRDGQIWTLPDLLGHDLRQSAVVSRTSSQDPGADTLSDVIVATASLEVGYDDPDVGVVVHHKAPRNFASYLQRKGRAGRRRGSRPTTLVILADGGRDRWLFQNSERLFTPEIEPIKVPLLNPYVQRIQVASFLIDWIGRRVRLPDPVRYLRRPEPYLAEARNRAVALLRDLLLLEDTYAAFRRDLSWVYRNTQRFWSVEPEILEQQIDAVLWDSPRPVLRHAVPALLRRLEADWRYADPARSSEREEQGARQPLPSFIPSASFADLSASEIIVEFAKTGKASEMRGVGAQLGESCPGRVSKRFSVAGDERGYWLRGSGDLIGATSPVRLAIDDLFADRLELRPGVYQPLRMLLEQRPHAVKDSANASWHWSADLSAIGEGRDLPLFDPANWSGIFISATLYLHGDGCAVRIERSASEGRFDILQRDGTEHRGRLLLEGRGANGTPVSQAVGFEQQVDSLAITIAPELLVDLRPSDPAALGQLRQEYFLFLLQSTEAMLDQAGPKVLEALWRTCLAMLTATAVARRCSLAQAQTELVGQRIAALGKVLTRMTSVADTDLDDDPNAGGRVRDKLQAFWIDPRLSAQIETLERVLWEPLGAEFDAWLRTRTLRTFAEALLVAVQTLAEDIGEADLVVDVVDVPNHAAAGEAAASEDSGGLAAGHRDLAQPPTIYISETAPGGIGQIEAFAQLAIDGGDAFVRAFRHALGYCARDQQSRNVLSVAWAARTQDRLGQAFAAVRAARGYRETESAQVGLIDELERSGQVVARSDVVAVVAKLLGPGSSAVTDGWLELLNRRWRRLEARLGMAIDPQVFGYLCLASDPLRRRLSALVRSLTGTDPSNAQLFARLQDFLLPECQSACPQCLENSNRFERNQSPSRYLALAALAARQAPAPTVDFAVGWETQVRDLLMRRQAVDLLADATALPTIAAAIQHLIADPVDRDYFVTWPTLERVTREADRWRFRFAVRAPGALT